MEEMLGNVAGASQPWMEWQPEERAWHSYINFQLKNTDVERARTIYERLVFVHPAVKNWIKYAQFEEKLLILPMRRKSTRKQLSSLEINIWTNICMWPKFKENQKKKLKGISKQEAQELFKNYTIFEKKFGDGRSIENIRSKRRFQYEEEVKANPHNYGTWIDYLRLVDSDAEADPVRDVYEGAIASLRPIQEKSHWESHVYLWINHALYEELEAKASAMAKLWKKQQEEKEAAEQDPDKDIDESESSSF
ncbi:hypothetical protein ACRRTK_017780 [Alexandromys fortis]